MWPWSTRRRFSESLEGAIPVGLLASNRALDEMPTVLAYFQEEAVALLVWPFVMTKLERRGGRAICLAPPVAEPESAPVDAVRASLLRI